MTIVFKMNGEEDGYYDPSIAIVDGDTYIEGVAEITMGVVVNDTYTEIYQIICQLYGTLDFVIKEGFIIDPDIQTLKLKVI